MTVFTLNQPGPSGIAARLAWRSLDYGNTTSPCFLHAWQASVSSSTSESASRIVVPIIGTLLNLNILSIGIVPTVTYTIRVNGVDTSISVSLATLATSGSDNTHSTTVSPGDIITIKTVTSSADTNPVYPSAFIDFKASS